MRGAEKREGGLAMVELGQRFPAEFTPPGMKKLKLPMFLSLVTVVMLLFSGWLGAKMVYEAGVGVDTTPR
jgi:hypothetical protein